jgi:sugar/nucleoside kinase (ribokinase family)
MKEIAEALLDWGPNTAIIKRGPGGACWRGRVTSSFLVEVVDNTGAGDA